MFIELTHRDTGKFLINTTAVQLVWPDQSWGGCMVYTNYHNYTGIPIKESYYTICCILQSNSLCGYLGEDET